MKDLRTEYALFEKTAEQAAANGWSFDRYVSHYRNRISPSYRLRYNDLLQKYQVREEIKRREAEAFSERQRLEREIARAMQ